MAVAPEKIRNFSIIAHIDHGKSTLADRFLELTEAVPRRKMRAQILDAMELERERGITIKMTPVTMNYRGHLLNLIDTPGHIDFSYEVSRALRAVEGAVLLVDASQGVQAQTLSVLELAREAGLTIVPAINKIDLVVARVEETKEEICDLLKCPPSDICLLSAKTGEGVAELLEMIIARVPPPLPRGRGGLRALVFDFEYSNHQGIIVYARLFDGAVGAGDDLRFAVTADRFKVLEAGEFRPGRVATGGLGAGQIGYLVTGIKILGRTRVGDTIIGVASDIPPVAGYREPKPVVWASIYPQSRDEFGLLKRALLTLALSDAALSFEEESVLDLGKGFRCGFLGMLHLEIATERLRREFGLNLILASPTIGYELEGADGKREFVASPQLFPEELGRRRVWEPWIRTDIIMPPSELGRVVKLFHGHEGRLTETINFGSGRTRLLGEMPLRELMRGFFSHLKSATSGLASLSYELIGWREAGVVRLDILLNGEVVPAFSRVVSKQKAVQEAEAVAERLATLLPRQLIEIRIQARVLGRILASRRLPALKKDVTGYLYGGDITRKMKLREKQKRGKKRMQARGQVQVPAEVFLKMVGSTEERQRAV